MPDVPVDVVIAAFPTEDGAKTALQELDEAHKQGLISIKDAAVLRRDADNKLHVMETADKSWGRGAMIGGVGGAVVGLIAGPVGWAALGGAAIGGLAAKLRDGGFPDQRLREIGESLKPGSSGLVAIVEETWVIKVQDQLKQMAGDVITEEIGADLAMQLDQEAARMKAQQPQVVPPQQPDSDTTDNQQTRAA
jgi:uncharacterized membrane protein